jgi:hypothetical protein
MLLRQLTLRELAERLFLAQPSLSKQIKDLVDEIGFPIYVLAIRYGERRGSRDSTRRLCSLGVIRDQHAPTSKSNSLARDPSDHRQMRSMNWFGIRALTEHRLVRQHHIGQHIPAPNQVLQK